MWPLWGVCPEDCLLLYLLQVLVKFLLVLTMVQLVLVSPSGLRLRCSQGVMASCYFFRVLEEFLTLRVLEQSSREATALLSGQQSSEQLRRWNIIILKGNNTILLHHHPSPLPILIYPSFPIIILYRHLLIDQALKKQKDPMASPSSAPQLPSMVLPWISPQYFQAIQLSYILSNLILLLAGSKVPLIVKGPLMSVPFACIFPSSILKVSKCMSQSMLFCLQVPFHPCLGTTQVNFHPPLQQSSSSPQLPDRTPPSFFPAKNSSLPYCQKVSLKLRFPWSLVPLNLNPPLFGCEPLPQIFPLSQWIFWKVRSCTMVQLSSSYSRKYPRQWGLV